MIGQSQSGTGKTAAFVLTMLSRIDYTVNKTQVRSASPPPTLILFLLDPNILAPGNMLDPFTGISKADYDCRYHHGQIHQSHDRIWNQRGESEGQWAYHCTHSRRNARDCLWITTAKAIGYLRFEDVCGR